MKPLYLVTKLTDHTFCITKYICGGIVEDKYHVTFAAKYSKNRGIKCDCMGFARQHYDKIDHKHVKMVLDFKNRGAPGRGLYYTLNKTDPVLAEETW